MIFDVATKFSKYPGGRFIKHGPHSGEDFLLRFLVPAFNEALISREPVTFDFSGCMGMTYGFLDQSFGELAVAHGPKVVKELIKITDSREHRAYVEKELEEVIDNATKDWELKSVHGRHLDHVHALNGKSTDRIRYVEKTCEL